MKKLLYLFTLILTASVANAQTPQGINYQAVARNAAGNILANTNICVQSTITNGNGGAVLYQETFNVTTNQFGLFTLNIGNGTVVSGTFATISWASVTPWQKMEIKINCTGAYVLMGSAQLLSVPYAFNAASSADNKWTQNGNDISNTNTGNVGIGIATPPANLKLNVAGRFAPDWGNNTDASYRFGDGTENTGFSSPNPNEIAVITNGSESVRINGIGRVGIGTSNPQAKLDVNGNVRINDGTQGDGKVLTSDGFGTASWKGTIACSAGNAGALTQYDTITGGYHWLALDSELYDIGGNNYDPISGIFTVPENGIYQFNLVIWLLRYNGNSIGDDLELRLDKNNAYYIASLYQTTTTNYYSLTLSMDAQLITGDTMRFSIENYGNDSFIAWPSNGRARMSITKVN